MFDVKQEIRRIMKNLSMGEIWLTFFVQFMEGIFDVRKLFDQDFQRLLLLLLNSLIDILQSNSFEYLNASSSLKLKECFALLGDW